MLDGALRVVVRGQTIRRFVLWMDEMHRLRGGEETIELLRASFYPCRRVRAFHEAIVP